MKKVSLKSMVSTLPSWMSGDWNDDGDIVVGSEVCMYRNLSGEKFPHMQSPEERKRVLGHVMSRASGIMDSGAVRLDSLSYYEKLFLYERRVIDSVVDNCNTFSCASVASGNTSMSINEDDHVKIKSFFPGNGIDSALSATFEAERDMDMDFAINGDRYATVEMSMHGSGIIASTILHLPATHMTGGSVLSALKLSSFPKMHSMCLFSSEEKSSNMIIVGFMSPTIRDIPSHVSKLNSMVDSLVDIEMSRREIMKNEYADIPCRAWGLLTNARTLSSSEACRAISYCVAGVGRVIEAGIDGNKLKKSLLAAMDGHMAMTTDKRDDKWLDEQRAKIVSESLFLKTGRGMMP